MFCNVCKLVALFAIIRFRPDVKLVMLGVVVGFTGFTGLTGLFGLTGLLGLTVLLGLTGLTGLLGLTGFIGLTGGLTTSLQV